MRREIYGKEDLGYLGEGYCGAKAIDKSAGSNIETDDMNKVIEEITLRVIEEINKAGR